MGTIGFPEMIFIAVLALLIFGPKKLPELARTLGKAMAEFRKASTDLRSQLEDEVRTLEQHVQSSLDGAESAQPDATLPAPYQEASVGPAPPVRDSSTAEEPKTDAETNTSG